MTKGIVMLQGTASSVGKSLLCAALCRIFRQDGYRAVPFKAQNMALNSAVTEDGLEMGRAQVMQAEAAGIEPLVEMNPVLLKPTSDQGSQVVVMGRPAGNMEAMAYLDWREKLLPVIDKAFEKLYRQSDIVVIEGAGSPAEINLRQNDLVNMGLARRLQAPVLLVGDIDRGGVFASLYGTAALLEADDRRLLRGLIINKFRGDRKVLEPGLEQISSLVNLPVLGVVPFISLNLDDEDSVTDRLRGRSCGGGLLIQVVLPPRLANFTDFNPLELFEDVTLSFIREPSGLASPDLLILPGSKNTIGDLLTLRRAGWDKAMKEYVQSGGLLMGICGGFQMLGEKVCDPEGVEGTDLEALGFGLLPLTTVMAAEKSTRRVEASWLYRDNNFFQEMTGEEKLQGYEIHMGRTDYGSLRQPLLIRSTGRKEGGVSGDGHVFGTYLHGIFDNLTWTARLLNGLRRRRGLAVHNGPTFASYREFKEKEYDRLADTVRESLDLA
ncbi:MAG TPA: cobyric acid synthase, partial [Firmicutes bacterium]|nr:cobyric acid synthase [Bacillota bacterium]